MKKKYRRLRKSARALALALRYNADGIEDALRALEDELELGAPSHVLQRMIAVTEQRMQKVEHVLKPHPKHAPGPRPVPDIPADEADGDDPPA